MFGPFSCLRCCFEKHIHRRLQGLPGEYQLREKELLTFEFQPDFVGGWFNDLLDSLLRLTTGLQDIRFDLTILDLGSPKNI